MLTAEDLAWAAAFADKARAYLLEGDFFSYSDTHEPNEEEWRARILSVGTWSPEFRHLLGVLPTDCVVHVPECPDEMDLWVSRRGELEEAISEFGRAKAEGRLYLGDRLRHVPLGAEQLGLAEGDWEWAQKTVRTMLDEGLLPGTDRWRIRGRLEIVDWTRTNDVESPTLLERQARLVAATSAMGIDEQTYISRRANPLVYPEPEDLVNADRRWLMELVSSGIVGSYEFRLEGTHVKHVLLARYVANRPHTRGRDLVPAEKEYVANLEMQFAEMSRMRDLRLREEEIDALNPLDLPFHGRYQLSIPTWAHWVLMNAPDGADGKVRAEWVDKQIFDRAEFEDSPTYEGFSDLIEVLIEASMVAQVWWEGALDENSAGEWAVRLCRERLIEYPAEWDED